MRIRTRDRPEQRRLPLVMAGQALRDAHISETAMKFHEIKCLLDGCERFPSSWPGLSGPPVPPRAPTDGPGQPGHDEVAMAAADRFQDLCMRQGVVPAIHPPPSKRRWPGHARP